MDCVVKEEDIIKLHNRIYKASCKKTYRSLVDRMNCNSIFKDD